MELYLEIFFSKIVDGSVIYSKRLINITGQAINPDKLVQQTLTRYLPQETVEVSDLVIHSTSWRYDELGKLIVTYLVYSEKFSFSSEKPVFLSLENLQIATSDEPHAPHPCGLEEYHIISHGFRHLSFLVKTDPAIKAIFSATKATLFTLETLPIALSGKISN